MKCTPSQSPENFPRHAILVVDDQPINLAVLKGILGNRYDLQSARSGREAIAHATYGSFDLILLDIMMPEMSGFDTLARLRQLPGFGSTPVIFLTASQAEHDERTGLEMGAADYIVKPLVAEHVHLRIANILQRATLQKQLQLALDSAELGIWEFDACRDRARIAPSSGAPLKTEHAGRPDDWIEWATVVHPACLPDLQAAIVSALNGATRSIDIDIRLMNREGEWQWFHIYGKPTYRGPCGQAIRLMGTYRNIQRRKQSEDARRDSEERLQLVMEATGEGVWDWDIVGNSVTHNASWCRILGLEAHFAQHDIDFFKKLIHPDDEQNVTASLVRCLGGDSDYTSEHRLRRADGEYVWVQDRGRVVRHAEDGTPLRMVGSIRDISEQKRAEAKILELAFYDPLTGLPNRRLLVDRVGQAIVANSRHHNHSALFFIDMDRFKSINDTYGHETGDALLVEVGRRLLACVREADTVARLGGDEFVILTNGLGTDPAQAADNGQRIGETMLASLNAPYLLGKTTLHSTPSIGITVFSGPPATIESTLKQADKAMYEAKADGRNCVKQAVDQGAETGNG